IASTDALGHTEHYVYNGAGEKVSFTNKNGATWDYEYDSIGRLVKETTPLVALTTVTTDATGRLLQGAVTQERVVNLTAYDALGNVTARTEAAGRPEQRTTRYEYDAMGRQVKTTFPSAGVYDPAADDLTGNGATGVAARTETTRPLSSQVFYDSFGDAVA